MRWFLKYTPVFNICQCRGIQEPEREERDLQPLVACTSFLDGLKEKPRIENGQLAAYIPSQDKIVMPAIKHFRDPESYHSSLFHELTHWTGAAHRLARPLIHFTADRKSYAREELVAEMGAAFLCAKCQIDTATIENHAAYIDSWLQALRNDRKLITEAAKAARIAVEYLEVGAASAS
jgi:antirestriction protein ArdC